VRGGFRGGAVTSRGARWMDGVAHQRDAIGGGYHDRTRRELAASWPPHSAGPVAVREGETDRYHRLRAARGRELRPVSRPRNGIAAERPDFAGRRPGVFGSGLLRRRNRDAQSGCPGQGRAAVYPVLQHGAVLADAGGAADRILPAASASRHDSRRTQERGSRDAAGVGAVVIRGPETSRLSLLSFGKMARRWRARGERVRPFLLSERFGQVFQPAGTF